MSEPSLGEIAYETYRTHHVAGRLLDPFWKQSIGERECWDEVGDAVRAYLTQDMVQQPPAQFQHSPACVYENHQFERRMARIPIGDPGCICTVGGGE